MNIKRKKELPKVAFAKKELSLYYLKPRKEDQYMYNEVTLIGRIVSWQKNIMCNNYKSIRLRIEIENEDNKKEERDTAIVYIYDDNCISKKIKRNKVIAFSGHIECGVKIISDVIYLEQ